jgi:hypothetical protein
MVEIYRNAYITLCNSSSTSCRQSFLNISRQMEQTLRIDVVADGFDAWEDQPRSSYELFQKPEDAFDPLREPHCSFSDDVFDSEWYSRGWVYQETTFSRRRLIFDPSFVLFECSNSFSCENGHSHLYREADGLTKRIGRPSTKRLEEKPFDFFQYAVQTFSQKKLTYESDRLPALAGTITEISNATGSEFLAGVWRDNLHSDLLFQWYSLKNERPTIMERVRILAAKDYVGGPSWSWPSMGGVRYNAFAIPGPDPDTWRLECDIIDVRIDHQDNAPDSISYVRHGELHLHTRMTTISNLVTHSASSDSRQHKYEEIFADMGPNPHAFETSCGLLWHWDVQTEDLPPDVDEDILLVLISSSVYGKSSGMDERLIHEVRDRRIHGLIVYPAENQESASGLSVDNTNGMRVHRGLTAAFPRKYHRIGVFAPYDKQGGMAMLGTWQESDIILI